MRSEERDAFTAYVSEVGNFSRSYAKQFEALKLAIVQKGVLTSSEIEEALKRVETKLAVEEATDPWFKLLARLRSWIAEQK